MPDPITFASTSPRYGLAYLFPGQSQREFAVNQAHAVTDSLLHPAIEGIANSPPASPQDGECWQIGPAPSGEFAGQSGKLACRQAGAWLFVTQRNGLRVFDKATGQTAHYYGEWHRASPVAAPAGGATVDAEARVAIVGLIAALTAGGLLPA